VLARDFGTLWRLARGLPTSGSQAERLQAFYAPQAADYDTFRERLLCGRESLIDALALAPDLRIVELGAGTGHNLERYRALLPQLAAVHLVDLCPALLAVARARVAGCSNVAVVEADAACFQPPALADRVYFSYALTMMPQWERALDNAVAMLRGGGLLGAVDFQLPPALAGSRGSHWRRAFWRRWFAHDGVSLSDALLPALLARTETRFLHQGQARVPYLPGMVVPYFVYVGRKP